MSVIVAPLSAPKIGRTRRAARHRASDVLAPEPEDTIAEDEYRAGPA
jgi:hypothetical protein